MFKVFLFAFILSIVFTWISIKISYKFNILDYPDKRKIHLKPTPILGGLGIFTAYALAILFNFRFSWELKGIVIASAIILIVGIIDDAKGLPAFLRLLVQIACALIVVSFNVHLKIIPGTGHHLLFLEGLLTVIWIVGITNAMNFLDGMDGLAGGVSVIAAGTFGIIAYQTGQYYFDFLTLALAGACLGFLIFNLHPAKIFLGDAGSSFLGFSLASLAVMGEWSVNRPIVAMSIPILILGILIFDITYISISRIYRGKVRTFKEWIEYVGLDHLHHRMLKLGFSTNETVLFIYLINIVFCVSALVLRKATTYQAVLLLVQGVLVFIVITILMLVGRKYVDTNNHEN